MTSTFPRSRIQPKVWTLAYYSCVPPHSHMYSYIAKPGDLKETFVKCVVILANCNVYKPELRACQNSHDTERSASQFLNSRADVEQHCRRFIKAAQCFVTRYALRNLRNRWRRPLWNMWPTEWEYAETSSHTGELTRVAKHTKYPVPRYAVN